MAPHRRGCWAQQAKEKGGTGFPQRTAPWRVSPSPHKSGTNRSLHRCLLPYPSLRSPPPSFSCPSPRLCKSARLHKPALRFTPGTTQSPARVARCKRRSSRQVLLSAGARALTPREEAAVPSSALHPLSFQPCLAVTVASKEESDSLNVAAGGCFPPRDSWQPAVFRKRLFSD